MNSRRAAIAITKDLQRRWGLGHEWGKVEPDIQEEITTVWSGIIAHYCADDSPELDDNAVLAVEHATQYEREDYYENS